jgi:hypothetical protein
MEKEGMPAQNSLVGEATNLLPLLGKETGGAVGGKSALTVRHHPHFSRTVIVTQWEDGDEPIL